MKTEVLDCTLRDGGYCNNWDFGMENIRYIVRKLVQAKVDIAEIGFLSDTQEETGENTIFRTVGKLRSVLPEEETGTKFVCMCNYGEMDFRKLPRREETGLSGIRLAFHKKQWREALEDARLIMEKGYRLYVQPMVTMSYTDRELLDLIEAANLLHPDSFYIVDSFGIVTREDLLRMYFLIHHNLDADIKIGYHSHNNMQLAYANARSFAEITDKRNKILDSSVFGMGRGAGNLNTELFALYLNRCQDAGYVIPPLLQIIDNVLDGIYRTRYWGYSLPHYLSARHNCHPNYASYLSDKDSLGMESMDEVLKLLKEEEKMKYDRELIERLYRDYQNNEYNDAREIGVLKQYFHGRKIVLLCSETPVREHREELEEQISRMDAVTVSVNFVPEGMETDLVFMSNEKRYEQMLEQRRCKERKLIVTSNIRIHGDGPACYINYDAVKQEEGDIEDNGAQMLLELLSRLGIEEVLIAGLDDTREGLKLYCVSTTQ